jgi:hypothetical protein
MRRLLLAVFYLCLCAQPEWLTAQQPFFTDDADVTEKGKFHLEVSNEFDILQRSSLPLKFQNATRATVAYGITKNVEVSVTGLFLAVASGENPRLVGGVGDTTFSVKYNFLKERKGSLLPALTLSGYIQTPTGNKDRGLGSGVFDYGLIGVAQKTFKEKNVVRLNAGILFSGNTQTGALGIAVVRGNAYPVSMSYVRTLNDKLQLGAEITTVVTSNAQLSKGQLQTQFGGNYQIGKNTTLDFGLIVGRFSASPRAGFQIGFSHDFR